MCVRLRGGRHGARQVEYPAGQVSPPALLSALTRAGVGADTLNSVAGKLLAAPYLQGGVSLDALSSSSLLRDRDMHGGAVKPTVIVAVKQALGVRLRWRLSFRGSACGLRRPPRTGTAERAHVCCASQWDEGARRYPPFLLFECRGCLWSAITAM